MSTDLNPQDVTEKIDIPDAVAAPDDYDPALENIRERRTLRQLIHDAPSVMFSLAVHGAALLLLGLFSLPVIVDFRADLTALPDDSEELQDVELFEEEPPKEINLDPTAEVVDTTIETIPTEVAFDEPIKMEVATADIGNIMSPDTLMSKMGAIDGAFGGRKNRGAAVSQGGGSEASERAVALGLSWIADHQLPNGAWAYTQLGNPNCRGKCKDSMLDKANKSLISATSMALLPMLGSGITHKDGKYKKAVKEGLDYITSNMRVEVKDGIPVAILGEKSASPIMYHHGLSTIVICESAAMTRDKNLENLAQRAINYICWAQDPVGGGWRYTPKQPGDTSGMGWNLMALKSAQMGYLQVPPLTISRVRHFLNNVVGGEGGAVYGYTSNNPNEPEGLKSQRPGLTSVGLLCQMYLGWKADHPGLIKGTDYLAKWGPNTSNLYYSYYATQVMHHVGGEKWEKWNKKMRDGLVEKQIVADGHEKGSWPIEGGLVGDQGGRLTCTSLAVMILEVYYRHLPLYRKTSTAESFPLDDIDVKPAAKPEEKTKPEEKKEEGKKA